MNPVIIDYEQLVSSYWHNLTTVLRGFSAGPDQAFLDTWVPGEDDVRSILALIESARDGGLEELTVYLGPAVVQKIELQGLRQVAADYGKVSIETRGKGLDFRVTFDGAISVTGTGAQKSSSGAGSKTRRTAEAAPLLQASSTGDTLKDDAALPPDYRGSLERTVECLTHEDVLNPEAGLELVQSSHQGVTLTALIDRSNHTIRKARHHGCNSGEMRKVLDLLCAILENRPIQDCSDHAVVRLEYKLRNGLNNRPVAGIVMPENVGSAFRLPKQLSRDLLHAYRQRTGFSDTKNFYDPPPSRQWRALSESERVERIQAAIDTHPDGKGVKVIRLEGPQRFVIALPHDVDSRPKGRRLIQLEAHVKREVEATLYLDMQPRLDQNKLRRLNDKGFRES